MERKWKGGEEKTIARYGLLSYVLFVCLSEMFKHIRPGVQILAQMPIKMRTEIVIEWNHGFVY